MNILVFEDNKDDLEHLKKCIDTFFREKDVKYNINFTTDVKYIINHILDFDIFFLDIEVKGFNGIDVGIEIRNINYEAKIIFVSSFSKYIIDGYKAQANRYFIKPIDQDFFNREMNAVLINYLNKFEGFIDRKISPSKIYYNEILYIEFLNKRSYLHHKSGNVFKTQKQLKYWKEILPNYFAQSHKSYIVNLNYISGFKKNEIILENEEYIPISRNFKKQFDESYYILIERTL